MVKPVTPKKVCEMVFYNSLPAFLKYFEDYGNRATLENVFFKVRNLIPQTGGKTTLPELSEKSMPELLIFTEPKSGKNQKKKVIVKKEIEEGEIEIEGVEEIEVKEIAPEGEEETFKVKVVPEAKPIQVNEGRQLKSPEDIIKNPANKTIISKLGGLYKAGYSVEFISDFGQKNGFLSKNYTPKEVTWQLKNKGFISLTKE